MTIAWRQCDDKVYVRKYRRQIFGTSDDHYIIGFIEHMRRKLFADFKSKEVYVQAENQVELHVLNLHVSQRRK